MDITRISGIVENISPILDFSTSGETLFLIIKYIETIEENNVPFQIIHMALTKSYVHWKEQLIVGNSYTFNGHFIYCKDEIEGTNWYYAQNDCSFQLNASIKPSIEDKLMTTSINECLKDIIIPVDNILYDKAYISLYQPNSISLKGYYETTEMNITGKVYQFHKSGWIELITYDNNKSIICADKKYPVIKSTMGLGLYMTPSQNYPFNTLNKFTIITAYSVYPMYLWGRLYGFAATVRTHIATINTSDAISVGVPDTCRKKPRVIPLKLSSEVGDRCLMFAMWKSYAVKKMFYAVSFTLSENDTNIVFKNMLNLCSDKGNTLYDITKRPADAVIKEFSNPSYAELYVVRAGHDSDLLCCKMPKIWSTTDVHALVERKFSYCTDTVDEDLDYKYSLKLWEGPRGDNNQGGCNWSDAVQLAQNEVLIGTIEYVECYDHINFAIVTITDLRECKLRVLVNCNSDSSRLGHERTIEVLQYLANLTNGIDTNYIIVVRNPLFLTEIYNYKISNLDVKTSCYDIRIVVPPSNEETLMTGSVTRLSSVSVNFNESVRLLLFHCNDNFKAYSSNVNVTAIVLYKSMIFGNDKQCSMILRDMNNSDIITVYIPSTNNSFKSVTLGMCVRFSHCQVCVSQNRKFIYIKSADKREMSLEIIGFVENREHLIHIASCNHKPLKIAMFNEVHCDNKFMPFPKSPPIITVSKLYKSRKYNRCVWNLIGNITFIKTVSISLHCSNSSCTRKKYSGIMGKFICSICGSNSSLRPFWEAHVSFDDGSGECQLLMEGTVVTDMLKFQSSDPCAVIPIHENKISVLDTIKCIETCVELYGEIQYKSCEEKNVTHNATQGNTINNHNNTNSYLSHLEGQNLLSNFVRYCCNYIPLMEITGKILFKNNNEEFNVGTRNVNLQEVNIAKPYLAATSQFFTLSMRHVLFEVLFIKAVSGNILIDHITKQMQSFKHS